MKKKTETLWSCETKSWVFFKISVGDVCVKRGEIYASADVPAGDEARKPHSTCVVVCSDRSSKLQSRWPGQQTWISQQTWRPGIHGQHAGRFSVQGEPASRPGESLWAHMALLLSTLVVRLGSASPSYKDTHSTGTLVTTHWGPDIWRDPSILSTTKWTPQSCEHTTAVNICMSAPSIHTPLCSCFFVASFILALPKRPRSQHVYYFNSYFSVLFTTTHNTSIPYLV